MRLGDFAKIITTTFTDRMSINRYQDRDNADDTTDTILPETPIYEQVPCKLSFSSSEDPKDNEVDNVPVKIVPKIFCKLEADLRAGDFITVERFNDDGQLIATYAGKAGLPSVYSTHKEALFSIERSA